MTDTGEPDTRQPTQKSPDEEIRGILYPFQIPILYLKKYGSADGQAIVLNREVAENRKRFVKQSEPRIGIEVNCRFSR